jgi:predicted secreted protein
MIYRIAILSSLLLLFACSNSDSKSADVANNSVEMKTNQKEKEDAPADSSVIKVSTDSVFTIQLKASVGQGFSWQLNDSSYKKYLTYKGQTFENMNPAIEGADGIQHFKFQPTVTGTASLQFIYVQPFVKPYPKDAPVKNFTIQIIRP